MDQTCEHYLHDLAQRFLLEAVEAKQAYDSARSTDVEAANIGYASGRAQAYYEVLSMYLLNNPWKVNANAILAFV